MKTLPLVLIIAAGFGLSNSAGSQIPDSSRRQSAVVRPGTQGRVGQGGRGGRKQQLQQAQPPGAVNRPALERQIGQAIAKVMRRQLNLNDQQMQSLSRVNTKFDVQRRNLLRDERTTRQGLKAAMADTVAPDQNAQNRISQYLDQILQEPHRRADLQAAEQKELSSFLTPMQRARYLVIKEQVTARIQRAAEGGLGGGRRGGPPSEP